MTLTKQGAFTFDHSNQQDDLYKVKTALEIKQALDSRGNELKTTVNNLIDALQSYASGDSGAKYIGAESITGLTGNNVQILLGSLKTLIDTKSNSTDVYSKNDLLSAADGSSGADKVKATPIATSPDTIQGILEWLKTQIDNTTLGQVPDGSLTDVKLSNDPAAIKQSFTSHKTENATTTTKGHVQLSSATDSTLETLAATPKAVKTAFDLANGAIPSSQKGVANGIATLGSDGKLSPSQKPIVNLSDVLYSAGTAIIRTVSNATTHGSLTMTKVREIKTNISGVVRVSFTMNSNTSTFTSTGQVYINNTPVGILRSSNSATELTYTEDFSVKAGDLISIYTKISSSGGNVYQSSMTIGVADNTEVIL